MPVTLLPADRMPRLPQMVLASTNAAHAVLKVHGERLGVAAEELRMRCIVGALCGQMIDAATPLLAPGTIKEYSFGLGEEMLTILVGYKCPGLSGSHEDDAGLFVGLMLEAEARHYLRDAEVRAGPWNA